MAVPSSFYQFITPYLSGVSEPLMDQEILRIARDIAVRTHCETITQRINSLVNTNNYALTPGSEREAVRLMDAYYNTTELEQVASPDISNPLALVGAIGAASPVSQDPQAVFTDNPLTQIYVYPVPSTAVTQGITVRFTVRPTPASTTVPDILLRYESVVAKGVIMNCLAIPGQPFSNTSAYMLYKMEYENLLAAMRAEIARGNSRSKRRVNPVRFM